jgi:hypothetical protein
MSQRTVQLLIGKIVTDEELRQRFVDCPLDTLTTLRNEGVELTNLEVDALVKTDRRLWDATAKRLHPRLQRCNIRLNCDE